MFCFFNNGYFEDGLKAFVYFVPLFYIIFNQRRLKIKYFWMMLAGLLLLFLGHLLDLSDEFKSIKYMFIIGKKHYLHDFFEDMIGFTLGFALFIWALFLEIKSRIIK